MSKNQSSPSFKNVVGLSEFLGRDLRYVDTAILSIHRNKGAVAWLKGCGTVRELPGFKHDLLLNEENPLVLKGRDHDWIMISWIIENGIEGWAYETVQVSLMFEHIFYFSHPGDRALARLTA